MNFSLTNLFNVGVLTSVLTLIIYHIFIYMGRRKSGKEKLYYLYFCLFAFNFTLYLLCVSSLHKFIFPDENIRRMISPAITGFSFFFMMHYVLKTFKIIFHFPLSKKKWLLPFYIPFIIYFILLGFYPFLDYDYYVKYFFTAEAYISTLATAYMFIFFVVHFFRTKALRKDLPSKTILFMFFIFMCDFFMEEMLNILGIGYAFKGTYFISGVSVLMWAYALAVRFNNEHNELGVLKNKLEEKVEERTLQLKSANELRTTTFIELAHETRTPLTLIKNNIDDYTANYGRTKELDKIKADIDKINQLMGNILSIDRLEKGQNVYSHDKIINLSAFAAVKVKNFNAYASKKKIKLLTNIQDDIYLKTSVNALDSLFDNLIGNAIKFTDEGNVSVSLASHEKIILSIKDTGIGIPEKIQDKIFEPYFHFSKNDIPGFGMGLSIVKGIVNSLNGSIVVNSLENVGTEFIVEFDKYQIKSTDNVFDDYKIIPSHFEVNEVIQDEINHIDKPYVLVIEDNPELLLYLRDKLKSSYNIYVASDGDLALKKIIDNEVKPDLIISDVMMGKLDGIGFYEQLKQTNFHHIPIIYLTAKAEPKNRDKALAMGAIDYIYKPFDISEVMNKIASIIGYSKNQRDIEVNNIKKLLEIHQSRHFTGKHMNYDNFELNCIQYKISSREKDIIRLARIGKTYKEIAEELNISPKTVNTHFQNIFNKAKVNKIQELLNKLYV